MGTVPCGSAIANCVCSLARFPARPMSNWPGLGTSLPAVKKIWVSIYRRVEECLPELVPDLLPSDIPAAGRGREKRRHLLAYLREHPEELRPVSRVFRQNPTKMKMVAR